MLRRGIKRKHPGGDQSVDNYTRNLSNFQMAARNRESLRLKNEVSSLNPAGVERHLKDKLAIEMSLIEGTAKFIMASKNQKQVRDQSGVENFCPLFPTDRCPLDSRGCKDSPRVPTQSRHAEVRRQQASQGQGESADETGKAVIRLPKPVEHQNSSSLEEEGE